jgi:hypothetical protein
MTAEQAGAYLKVNKKQIYTLCKLEGLPFAPIGNGKKKPHIRLKREWIDAWLVARQTVNKF